ncbi:M15 family metallopeptidase [Dinghuibacter silviterrae]|uniref:D-alanyl-D-alanine dipeptidase n=1 Tax=Dinghuibacter silviterrae TaxID=1539049 RepID=A0A4R8DUE7_9BACT|nr:M15 family metallopeptidase [Dinghuibacter silviterrae]TDX01994.1 D-alanyl-D-alanine dipeptidase [Dinghuibacter silviterrae]
MKTAVALFAAAMRCAAALVLCTAAQAQSAATPHYGLPTVHDTAVYFASVRQDPRQALVPLKGFRLDIRYATADNLLHRPVYTMAAAFLRKPAAEALKAVDQDLEREGYALKIFDGYRPYAATVAFYEAYHDTNYVASPYTGSRHNRGCAVDLTLVDRRTGKDVAMPTPFDDFTEKASATYADLPPDVLRHRKLLQDAMLRHGFLVYPHEWWHFDFAGWRDYPVTDIPFEALTSAR